jgi:hypothetical protein
MILCWNFPGDNTPGLPWWQVAIPPYILHRSAVRGGWLDYKFLLYLLHPKIETEDESIDSRWSYVEKISAVPQLDLT